jgi:formylglycine-generating enzyme
MNSNDAPKPGRQPSPHDVPPRTIALIVAVMVVGLAIGMLLIMPHYGPRKPRHRSALGHVLPTSMIGRETNGMVWIPGSTFLMGSESGHPDEAPAHEVTVAPFWMDKTEVIEEQFAKFAQATQRSWSAPTTSNPSNPVVNVMWEDANAYAKWAGKRLPTEAEWECAARGGLNQEPYIWGSDEPSANRANIGLQGASVASAASYSTNSYGLHDMAGNVWEWCADWYDPNFYKQSTKLNPKGPPNGTDRVIRGGSFLSTQNNDRGYRPSARNKLPPETRRLDLGFRCVQNAY